MQGISARMKKTQNAEGKVRKASISTYKLEGVDSLTEKKEKEKEKRKKVKSSWLDSVGNFVYKNLRPFWYGLFG